MRKRSLKKKGGGIFNRVKGLFTRKKKLTKITPINNTNTNIKNLKVPGLVAMRENYRMPLSLKGVQVSDSDLPEPADLWDKKEVIVNGNPVMLKREPLISTYGRLFSYFYRKAFGRSTFKENKISENEFIELSNRVREVSGWQKIPDNEEEVEEKRKKVADEVFGEEDESRFDTEILEEEVGPDAKTIGKKVINFDGTKYITDEYGRYFARYYPYFFTDYKKLLYLMEYDSYQCPGRNPEDDLQYRGPDGHRHQKPLTTLKSNLCISLFRSIETVREELTDTDEMRSNWLILNPDYFPAVQSNPFSKKDMSAKYFLKATFIQDALDNWGIHGIDPLLFELLQKRYPEIAIKMSTYILNTEDFAYQYAKINTYENIMIIDKDLFTPEIALTIVYPFEDIQENAYKSVIEKAIRLRKLYGMSPYMAYIMKKKSLPMWKRAFQSDDNTRNTEIYMTLTPYEKIVIDYLQYIRFMNTLVNTNYNFVDARDSYMDYMGEQSIQTELVDYYSEEVNRNRDQCKFFQSLVKHQMPPEEQENSIETKEDIQRLLKKFLPFLSRLPLASMSKPMSMTIRQQPLAKVTSAFNRVRNVPKENREAQEKEESYKRLKELQSWLKENRKKYEGLLGRIGDEKSLKQRLNYFTKLKKTEKNTRRLSKLIKNEQQTRKNYEFVRNYPMKEAQAKAELARRKNKILQPGYYPLPSTTV